MSDELARPKGSSIVHDPYWLAHRYVEGKDAVQFLKLNRDDHDRATFIIDEYLPAGRDRLELSRRQAVDEVPGEVAPLHFILHSAFCCSTLLGRVFDWPGIATSLREPMILNDVVGYRRRGASGRQVAEVLDSALTLLARPLQAGDAVVIKPSNVINSLVPVMMAMRPKAAALLLYAPLNVFVTSVAKKGLDGRLWVRELFLGFRKDGLVQGLGFDDEQFFGQTDLQIAAVIWLAQQALFGRLIASLGPDRVRSLDSETLLARPADTLVELCRHYRLPITGEEAAAKAATPVFERDAKSGKPFGRDARAIEHGDAGSAYRDEIEKVVLWAEAVARANDIPLALEAPLLT